MSVITTMPRQVAVAINDLVDSCGEIKPGQQVLIVAASDGLTGGVISSMKRPSLGFRQPYSNAALMHPYYGPTFQAEFMPGEFRQ